MANRYAVTGQENAVTASLTTALDLVASATSRPEVYYISGSGGGAPADQSVRVTVARHTTANTGTAVVPTAIDPAALTAVATALENASAEGTYTAASELYDQAIHVRSQMYWWANYEQDRLVVPATAANGLGCRVAQAGGAYALAYDFTMHFVGP